jgi:23S rRNA (guanine745-N1)-methyltransferase
LPFDLTESRRLPLACSVRGCTLPLRRRDRSVVCDAGHAYDIARSGYINLLQPQDRRSRAAGDSKATIEARAALLKAGVGRTLIEALAAQAVTFDLGHEPVVVDLGCGSGDALAAIARQRASASIGIGIDLSTAAVERAARQFPDLTWVVANADRRLPVLDGSVDLVASIHGRRNPDEAARVLAPGRYLLIAVPAADDLIELRELVQGQRIEHDRSDAVLAEHESRFEMIERSVIRETVELDRTSLLDLLQGTYRGARLATAERVATLTRMRVTMASDVSVLRLR